MAPFRWPLVQHDVDLAKEVVASRPEKACDWDDIASRLNPLFSLTSGKAVELKGRSCRERMERLLNKHKADDASALRSEEEYSELHILREDIAVYRQDLQEKREKEKEAKQKKIEEEANRGHEMRRAALSRMAVHVTEQRLDDIDASSSDEEGGHESPERVKKTGKKAKKRATKLSAVEMLSKKYEKKAELKDKELEIRKLELEFQKRKFEDEAKERKTPFKMEMEERKVMLEMLQKRRGI